MLKIFKGRHAASAIMVAFLSVRTSPAIPDDNTGTATLERRGNASALKMSIVNSIVNYVANSAHVSIDIEFDWLPADSGLLQGAAAITDSPRSVHITLQNEMLGADDSGIPSWPSLIKDPDSRGLLARALGVSALDSIGAGGGIKAADAAFRKYWSESGGEGRKMAENGKISAAQYYGLLRDHNLLAYLLESNGIAYSLNIDGAQGKYPRVSDRGVTWEIGIYEFPVKPRKKGNTTILPGDAIYRVTAIAHIQRFKVVIPDAKNKDVKLHSDITFKRSANQVGLKAHRVFHTPDAVPLNLAPVTDVQLSASEDNLSDSSLEAGLKIVGGISLGEIVSSGLLGGTADTSIVSGGLVGAGKVDRVIGINREARRWGSNTLGGLFAISPGSDNALFIGPSLQLSVFTLSIGDRIFSKADGKGISDRIAGVASVDVSTLLGFRKANTKVPVSNSSTGGDITSDSLARTLALVNWKIERNDQLQVSEKSVTLQQITDSTGADISDKPNLQANVSLRVRDFKQGMSRLEFLPKGKYKVTVPEGLTLTSVEDGLESEPIPTGTIVTLTGPYARTIGWKLK